MPSEPERPLDYADAQLSPRPPRPAAVIAGVLLMTVGILVFVIGVMALGQELKGPFEFDPREWMFIAVGAFISWVGWTLKRANSAK